MPNSNPKEKALVRTKSKPPAPGHLTPKEARQVLASILAMLLELQSKDPELTLEGLKALLMIALVADQDQLRLPSVSKVAKVLGKSVSRGSRLVASLVDSKGLVQGKLGVSGDRSEALLLTERGHTLVTALLSAATSKVVSNFEIQSYERLVQERRRRTEDYPIMEVKRVSDDSLEMVVIPAEFAVADEIGEWCREHLSSEPLASNDRDGVKLRFGSPADAVYFRLRWC